MKGRTLIWVLVAGGLFGYGLALSTMIRPEVVLSFLRFQDFGLLLVLGGAAGRDALRLPVRPALLGKPLAADTFGVHPSAECRTLGGAAIFGIGWGLRRVPRPRARRTRRRQLALIVSVLRCSPAPTCRGGGSATDAAGCRRVSRRTSIVTPGLRATGSPRRRL